MATNLSVLCAFPSHISGLCASKRSPLHRTDRAAVSFTNKAQRHCCWSDFLQRALPTGFNYSWKAIVHTVPEFGIIGVLQLVFSIHGLRRHPHKLPSQAVEQSAAALLPGSGELVIAGDSAVLQFYDASRDRHIDQLQVMCPVLQSEPCLPILEIDQLGSSSYL